MKKPVLLSLLCILILNSACTETQSDLPSWALGGFVRPSELPVLGPDPSLVFDCPMQNVAIKWAESDIFNPAAIVKDGKICILFRAEDNTATGIGLRTSRIGLAQTTDGITMDIRQHPVMFPTEDNVKQYEWPGGCEDPRVAVTEDGLYVMAYTMWNRNTPRLGIATSRDLITWEKHGPAFETAYDGRFKDMACKSGSIVTSIKNGNQVITKVNGKYLMYWGELAVCAATSDDLIIWTPVLDEKNELKGLITPRQGYFDSSLTECGPPAIITKDGILLVYNGRNHPDPEIGDKRYPLGTYSGGQVLFDLKDPYKAIGRLDIPFFKPEADFEKSGQYTAGTVFIEGLVFYKEKWFMYYGCADSFVGLAVSEKNNL